MVGTVGQPPDGCIRRGPSSGAVVAVATCAAWLRPAPPRSGRSAC